MATGSRGERDGAGERGRPRHTGRHLVLLREGRGRAGAQRLRTACGLRVAISSDFEGPAGAAGLRSGEGMLFERLGVALLHTDPDLAAALVSHRNGDWLSFEPERVVRATGTAATATPAGAAAGAAFADSRDVTWGVQATRIAGSRYTGRGVRVAVLDTGIDAGHPDFADRALVTQSFVTGVAVDDTNGHGTYCAGIACGPARPSRAPRYGVACDAELHVGKVLGDDGNGADGNILAALDWAARTGCAVAALSLGTAVDPAQPPSTVFEQVAQRALAAGTLIVAAAGNDSLRPDFIAPVEHPANCPSILAVGAVNPRLGLAPFSCGGLNADGGQIDLVAPGVGVTSAWRRPVLYQMNSGTSMAAPFVVGIAALLAEAHPDCRGAALRDLLLGSVLPLPLPARDAGAGLALAPQ